MQETKDLLKTLRAQYFSLCLKTAILQNGSTTGVLAQPVLKSFYGKEGSMEINSRGIKQAVAAYCRVSTDSGDQAGSLENQKKFFNEYISRNPDWELLRIYSDEGVTGTSTKKRAAFNRMIEDAVSGKFDLIITKEISRFARNTLDSIFYTRKLKSLGVGVIFMNDNINTLDPDAELRLTIMSSIAQEESRKTSQRVKWGQKRRMEQGVVFGRDLLGYDVRGGKLYINKEGAKAVRLIFHKFTAQGKGTHVIARELCEEGIKTVTGTKNWSNTAVLRILRNEKYCGDLIQKKTYTPNYLTHEKKYNRGSDDLIILRDHHEPIITRELFNRACEELKRRSPAVSEKAKYSNRYCFSGKIKCGLCGASFVSRSKKRGQGVYRAWRCINAVRYGSSGENGCSCPAINESHLKAIMQQITGSLPLDKIFEEHIRGVLKNVISAGKPDKNSIDLKISKLRHKLNRLLELYLEGEISKEEFKKLRTMYKEKLQGLEKAAEEDAEADNPDPIKSIMDFVDALVCGEMWDDTFYRNIINKIVVSGNNAEVYLSFVPGKWEFLRS